MEVTDGATTREQQEAGWSAPAAGPGVAPQESTEAQAAAPTELLGQALEPTARRRRIALLLHATRPLRPPPRARRRLRRAARAAGSATAALRIRRDGPARSDELPLRRRRVARLRPAPGDHPRPHSRPRPAGAGGPGLLRRQLLVHHVVGP